MEAWENRLGPRTRLRVGLVWSGDPGHNNDHNRSIALRALAPLLDCDVQFVSLQKGIRDQDRAFLREREDILDPTEQLTDFSETAALVSCLDLVISVDTSVVHLTGGLGVPVWTMLPFNPDWRWLLNRDDSPWYSSMRLFRQPTRDDWASVVEDVRHELEALVSAWRPDTPPHRSDALPLMQDDALVSNYLGDQLWQLKRMDEALLHFQQALILNPRYFEAAENCGRLLLDLGRPAEALECLDAAERLNPNSASLYRIRGICLQEANRFADAEADFEKSIALDASVAETHNNLGLLHWKLGRADQAFASIDRAVALRPDFAAAFANKAWMLLDLQLLDQASAAFRRSLAIDPNRASTIFSFALLQLLTGDFERGWAGREARWTASPLGLADLGFAQPLWRGEQPIAGKTILLYCDEGLGDSIQFARYVPMVAALGARSHPGGAAADPAALGWDRRGRGMYQPGSCGVAGIRPALPAWQPAARVQDAARHDPVRGRFSARARGGARDGVGEPAWSPHALPRRSGLVGRSRPQERSQPVDRSARACAAAWIATSSSSPCKRVSGSRTAPSSTSARISST